MYNINPKATTKITQQKSVAHKLTKKIKQNHNNSLREDGKRRKRKENTDGTNVKQRARWI